VICVLCVIVCALGIIMMTPRRADAQSVPLRIDCPALGNEGQAALEARARADLLVHQGASEVEVTCDASSATIRLPSATGEGRARTQTLGPDGAESVDAILGALHALLASGEPAGAGDPPTEQPRPEVSLDARQAVFGPSQRDVIPAATLIREGSTRLGLAFGADSELWQGAKSGAVGAHLGGRVSWPGGWSGVLLGGATFGVGSAQGTEAQMFRMVLRVDRLFLSSLRVGIGASARLLMAEGPDARQLVGTTAGALLSARYVLPVGSFDLSAGPDFEALARPVVVEVAGTEVFRVPTFVGAISFDAEAHVGSASRR
jgi:hypothetical protein